MDHKRDRVQAFEFANQGAEVGKTRRTFAFEFLLPANRLDDLADNLRQPRSFSRMYSMEPPAEALQPRRKDRTVNDVLTEDQVVVFVANDFKSRGFSNVKYNLTGSHGDDVTATDPSTEETWVIECKGEIKTKANADGTLAAPFTPNMCRQSIEAALYKAMRCQSEAILNPEWKRRVGMAFPNTPHYRDHLKAIIPCLKTTGIEVLLVSVKGFIKNHGEVFTF